MITKHVWLIVYPSAWTFPLPTLLYKYVPISSITRVCVISRHCWQKLRDVYSNKSAVFFLHTFYLQTNRMKSLDLTTRHIDFSTGNDKLSLTLEIQKIPSYFIWLENDQPPTDPRQYKTTENWNIKLISPLTWALSNNLHVYKNTNYCNKVY